MSEVAPEAGWYPDTEVDNALRYWDGSAWTEQRQPMPQDDPDPSPIGLRPDLAEALATQRSLFGYKKSLKFINDGLRSDERVLAATTCHLAKSKKSSEWIDGMLAVTDKRVVFVHARGFKRVTEEFALANISGVVSSHDMLFGHIAITGAGGITTNFKRIAKPRVQSILGAIQGHINGSQPINAAAPSAPPPSPAPSMADELGKLAGLHAQGILSADEFAAAKARLLLG